MTEIAGFEPAIAPTSGIEQIFSSNQIIPADIRPTDIRFNWATNKALWTDKTGAKTEFFDIGAMRDAFDREWPSVVQPKSEEFDDKLTGRERLVLRALDDLEKTRGSSLRDLPANELLGLVREKVKAMSADATVSERTLRKAKAYRRHTR